MSRKLSLLFHCDVHNLHSITASLTGVTFIGGSFYVPANEIESSSVSCGDYCR